MSTELPYPQATRYFAVENRQVREYRDYEEVFGKWLTFTGIAAFIFESEDDRRAHERGDTSVSWQVFFHRGWGWEQFCEWVEGTRS